MTVLPASGFFDATRLKRLAAALEHLSAGRAPYTTVRQAHLEDRLCERGISPTLASIVARVPRVPFVSPARWRLADSGVLAHPGLMAPADFAALLDSAQPFDGTRLVVVESRAGWCSVVAGAAGMLLDCPVATTANALEQPRGLTACLDDLGVTTGLRATGPWSAFDCCFFLTRRADRPPPEWTAQIRGDGCLVWIADDPASGARVRRLKLQNGELALSDMGEAI